MLIHKCEKQIKDIFSIFDITIKKDLKSFYKMKKYSCVIFDCDGILVDSEPLAEAVIVTMTNEIGIHINTEYAKINFKGDSFQNICNHLETKFQTKLPENFESEYRKRSFEFFSE